MPTVETPHFFSTAHLIITSTTMLLSRFPQCSAAAAAGTSKSSSGPGCLHAAASSSCSRASSLLLFSSRTALAAASSVSSNGRAAGVVCRDAPRPMWARKSPPLEAPQLSGSSLSSNITKQIMASDSIAALSDVFSEWGGSFNFIHASAALTKCVKVPGGPRSRLASKLSTTWLSQLPADMQGCANVLWASAKLSPEQSSKVWGPTWSAFMQHVEQALQGQSGEALVPQHLANAVYEATRLRKQPGAAELQLLVQAFLQPDVLEVAESQHIAIVAWAISQLSQSRGWQGGVSEQDVQQLLGEQQLRVLADGTPHEISNVLLGLARLAAGDHPLVGRDFAQQCSMQLLSLASTHVGKWVPQSITNTMWSTAELGLPADVFVAKAVQAAQAWVPISRDANLKQAAQACALLQYKDKAFLSRLLQQASVLLQQQRPGKARSSSSSSSSRVLSAGDREGLAAIFAASITQLDMQQLAGPVRVLVASSRVGQQAQTHPSNFRRLWLLHAWLLQQQLLDGRGLTGLVTQQQLQQGQKEAAVHGTGVTAAAQQ